MSGSPESAAKVWMSEPDREPPKSRGMKKLAGMDLEELRRVADVSRRRRDWRATTPSRAVNPARVRM